MRPFFFARCPSRHAAPRGFTLLELMVSVAVSTIACAGMLAAGLWQFKSASAQAAEMDARLQAHTIFAALSDATSWCGFGFGVAADGAGVLATGVCAQTDDYALTSGVERNAVWPFLPWQAKCAGRDNQGRNDRVRFAFAESGIIAYYAPTAPSAGPCGTDTSPPDPSYLHLAEGGTAVGLSANFPGPHTYPVGTRLFIGGRCQGGGSPAAGTDLIVLPYATPKDSPQCVQEQAPRYSNVFLSPPETLSCPNGYAPGFTLAGAQQLEIFSDVDPVTSLPRLRLAMGIWSGASQPPTILATGVTRFEVRYGFDTAPALSGHIGRCPGCTEDPYSGLVGSTRAWCREARAPDQGGNCLLTDDAGAVLNTRDLQRRIVAMHVTADLLLPRKSKLATLAFGPGSDATTRTFTHLYQLPNLAGG